MIKWFFFILAKIKLILIKVPCLLFFLLILAHNLPPSYFLIEEPYFHLNIRIPNYLIWKLYFALNSKKEYKALIENFLLFEFIPTTFFSLSLQIDLPCKTKINVFDTFPNFRSWNYFKQQILQHLHIPEIQESFELVMAYSEKK